MRNFVSRRLALLFTFLLFLGGILNQQVSFATDCATANRSLVVRIYGPEGQPAPLGFHSWTKFEDFGKTFREHAPTSDSKLFFGGSSVTGRSFLEGRPFGPHSDYDLAIVSEELLEKAKKIRVPLRTGNSRTVPLTNKHLKVLGLTNALDELKKKSNYKVSFMIYRDEKALLGRFGKENVIAVPLSYPK